MSGIIHDQYFNDVPTESQVQILHDGTFEITDTLTKQDYYRSLRRPLNGQTESPHLGLASQLSLDIANESTIKSGGGVFKKHRNNSLECKPSGRDEKCFVLMLEGVEKTFTIDHNAYGIQLFDQVCKSLDLRETEYFGLTYRGSPRTDYWLKLDKRLSKQLEKYPWKLEFHIRYYPLYIEELKDDLTRYCLCLQVRQDIISGQLPCTYQTYGILGAYTVQSEAGDYDPVTHVGTEYIENMPFAPQSLQTPHMLQRITELHRLHKGKTPVQADRGFLENARRLALYGVEFHEAKTPHEEPVSVGVYHSGILVYKGRVCIGRFLWPQLVKLAHKSKTFNMTIWAVNIGRQLRSLFSLKVENGAKSKARELKISNGVSDDELHRKCALNFICSDARLATRLWEACTTQHAFFRLRETPRPSRPNLTSAFAARKYHYSGKPLFDSGATSPRSPDWPKSPQPQIHRVTSQRVPEQYTPPIGGYAPVVSTEDADKYYVMPGSPSPLLAEDMDGDKLIDLPPAYKRPGPNRCSLAKEYWRMSPADCTVSIGMNSDGTDVAAMKDSDWQGCRTNWGLKWPGAYFYEAVLLESGPIRLGWSTNNASLVLGTDLQGFAYGIDEFVLSNSTITHGFFFHGNNEEIYGLQIVPGDVIGCFIYLDANENQLSVEWSHNGIMLGPIQLTTPHSVAVGEPVFPAASLKDARVAFNFGSKPLRFPPQQAAPNGQPWVSITNAHESSRVDNQNLGWRVNPSEVSSNKNLLISPNGRMVQAAAGTGWQGFRVNKGVFGGGKYYYEVTVVEDAGLARVGWSFDDASLDLGLDAFGYGFGADRDGFGINGTQGKKLHGDIIENYGEAFSKDDFIGCFLDLNTGCIQWSKNGRLFGTAYWLPEHAMKNRIPIYPAASLVDTTLELNYGDRPFKCPPEIDWLPLFAALDENVAEAESWQKLRLTERSESHLQGPRHQTESGTYVPQAPPRSSSIYPDDYRQSNGHGLADRLSAHADGSQEDEVQTFNEADIEEIPNDWSSREYEHSGMRSASFIDAVIERAEDDITRDVTEILHSNEADDALNDAIFETTRLNPDSAVVRESIEPSGHC